MTNDAKAWLAARFLDSFLREIVLDTAIHTSAKIKRARSICHLCGVRCQAHTPAAEQSASNSTLPSDNAAPSRSATPVPGSSSHKPDYYSNNPLFECLVCSRQVSSNRYATHLAKCMGMGSKGGRKGAARNAKATTSSLAGSTRQSGTGTPRYSSDADDDSFAKRKNGGAKNGTKRANSPLAASTLANARMNKRIKTSSPTPPPSDSLGMGMNRSYSSQPFAPSGLSTSTVLSRSPLNPNNSSTPLNGKAGPASGSLKNGKGASSPKKRKRLIDDDEEDDAESYHDASGGESNEEEGEISDDDDDVALAAGSASRPPSSGTKIKIPLRASPSSTTKPKTFVVADDSDSDTNPSSIRQTQQALDGDQDDEDEDDDDDEEDDDDEDDDDDEGDDDDDDDDVQVTRVTQGRSAAAKAQKPSSSSNGGGLQRERGSDGEFIDVESASDQSDADSF